MLYRNGDEIILSKELQKAIENIKPLPKEKLKEGLSLLNYRYPLNIIYFGYVNHCYDVDGLKELNTFFSCHRYFNFKEFHDYLNFCNSIFDKMGVTEEVYYEHKEYIKSLKKNLLGSNFLKYSLETRNNLAKVDCRFDDFSPYELNEYISDNNYYVTINFEYDGFNDTPYQLLDYYVYKKYSNEYENTDNEILLLFEKLYASILKDYQYSREITEENQVFIFLEDIKKEETDYLEYVNDDEEDKIIFFANNISVMLNIANQLANYYLDNEMEYRSVLDE